MLLEDRLKAAIREVPNFPKEGIIFRDISPLLQDGELFALMIDKMEAALKGCSFDKIVAIDARGFIMGASLASRLGKGLVLVRKQGKLPCECLSETYELEYGQATLEIHKDALSPGESVVIVDDLLATGGTAKAAITLCQSTGAKVAALVFVLELPQLKGVKKLEGIPVHFIIDF